MWAGPPRRYIRGAGDPPFGKGAAPGWGIISTPLPTRAWPRAGPVTPSPVRSYAAAVKEISVADDCPLSRDIRRLHVSPARFVGAPLGMERRVPFHVSRSGVAKGRCIVPRFEGWLN